MKAGAMMKIKALGHVVLKVTDLERAEPIDHEVTQSLYLEDPDGSGVELYVDVSESWRKDPQRVAQIMPLEL